MDIILFEDIFSLFFQKKTTSIVIKKIPPSSLIKTIEIVPAYRLKTMLKLKLDTKTARNLKTFIIKGNIASRTVIYKPHSHGYGRLNTGRVVNSSLLKLNRNHRHTLCIGISLDIDIKACYPSLILEINQALGFPSMPLWEKHWLDPQHFYKLGSSKDKAKELLFVLMFGGNIFYSKEPKEAIDYVAGLKKELDNFWGLFFYKVDTSEIEKKTCLFTGKKKIIPRLQHFILATMETRIMLAFNQKYPVNGVYMNDGFIIYNKNNPEAVISGVNEFFSFKYIKFIAKPYDVNYTLYPGLAEHAIDVSNIDLTKHFSIVSG
jgi:hypothetical protein